MDPKYDHTKVESRIYQMWEEGSYFTPKIDPKKKPFTIVLPLPNANDPIHMGHALFTVEDILTRYHRMKGDPTLWLPGGDHAGIETQFVFEKHLAKEGKSRFDFDHDILYQMIWDFTQKNKDLNKNQMKQLGFSLDWSRYHYSLEPEIVKRVIQTFIKLYKDGLVYRGKRVVNFCPKCGTSFSDLEVDRIEQVDPLYFVKYKRVDSSGFVTVATTRPEPIFVDTHLAVNPKDKKNAKLIGTKVFNPLTDNEMEIIGDEFVDPKFGTGIVKLTPAHDFADFEVAQKHHLPIIDAITKEGRITESGGKYAGLKVKEARDQVVTDLKAKDLIEKVDENYKHVVGICYRSKTIIEPLTIEQWFVKTEPLAEPAIEAVREGQTKIVPGKRFEKLFFDWMENIRDWNISRQIVWGPRIPAWYCQGCQEIVVSETEPDTCPICGQKNFVQDTDTFDTWFLSGQWPINSLKSKTGDFEYFYPTSVLDTLWDILFFWVARMMMFGLYLTGKVPFEIVHIHARVVDAKGQKMSKSKGNVINPMDMVDKYGADSLRMALVLGVAPASDIVISDDKVRAMRNFSNKLWNIGRFLLLNLEGKDVPWFDNKMAGLTIQDKTVLKSLQTLVRSTTSDVENFRFGQASENLYHFIWHELADKYIESSKERIKNNEAVVLSVLRHVFLNCLKLLHPFMPFVTEEIWLLLPRKYNDPLIVSSWPTA